MARKDIILSEIRKFRDLPQSKPLSTASEDDGHAVREVASGCDEVEEANSSHWLQDLLLVIEGFKNIPPLLSPLSSYSDVEVEEDQLVDGQRRTWTPEEASRLLQKAKNLFNVPKLLSQLPDRPRGQRSKQSTAFTRRHLRQKVRKVLDEVKKWKTLPPVLSPLPSGDHDEEVVPPLPYELPHTLSSTLPSWPSEDEIRAYSRLLKRNEFSLLRKKREEFERQLETSTSDRRTPPSLPSSQSSSLAPGVSALPPSIETPSGALNPVEKFINLLQPIRSPEPVRELAVSEELRVRPRKSVKNSQKLVDKEYSSKVLPRTNLKFLSMVAKGKPNQSGTKSCKMHVAPESLGIASCLSRSACSIIRESVESSQISVNLNPPSVASLNMTPPSVASVNTNPPSVVSINMNPPSVASSNVSSSSNISSGSNFSWSSGSSYVPVFNKARLKFLQAKHGKSLCRRREKSFPGYFERLRHRPPSALGTSTNGSNIQDKVMQWNDNSDRPLTPPTPMSITSITTPSASPNPHSSSLATCDSNGPLEFEFEFFDESFVLHSKEDSTVTFEQEFDSFLERGPSGALSPNSVSLLLDFG